MSSDKERAVVLTEDLSLVIHLIDKWIVIIQKAKIVHGVSANITAKIIDTKGYVTELNYNSEEGDNYPDPYQSVELMHYWNASLYSKRYVIQETWIEDDMLLLQCNLDSSYCIGYDITQYTYISLSTNSTFAYCEQNYDGHYMSYIDHLWKECTTICQ